MQETYDTIYQLLKTHAESAPQAAAIVAPGRGPLTYALLLQQVEHLAHSLHEMGVGRNDRVAVVLPNGPEMAVAFLGVAACATSAPLNPAFRAAEFDFLFSDLRPKALIVQSDTDSPAIAIAQKHCIPIIETLPDAGREAGTFLLKGKRRSCASQVGFAEAEDVAVILYTSGTTSRPKLVPLTQANILTSARAIATTLELTPEDRCLNVMPLFHIHGLVGALFSSMMAGASVICSAGFDSERFFTLLEEFHPTWYTAVPTIHQAVLSRASSYWEILHRCRLRFIRSSSAPLPFGVMQELERVFQIPVIESYGMTEASHQIASNPLPPRARKARSVGISAGAEIAVMNEQGDLLPPGSAGEVVIRGAAVMSGYANNADATQDRFKRGWFRTGDQGYLDADQYLFLTGRLDQTINRGGEKICPAEVEEVLKEHPAVSEAVTFAVGHPTLGQYVAAAVVLRGNESVSTAEIQNFAATRLADFKIPRQVLIVDTIPETATGKIQRNGLAEKLGLVTAGKNPDNVQAKFATPRTETEQTLAAIWSSVLGVNVGIEDNFFHLGGDSIRAAQVMSRIRESLGTELSLLSFFEAPTVANIARAIDTTAKKSGCFDAVRLQSIHGTGALALSFAQQRFWVLDQLEPGSPAYNHPIALRLTGKLQVQVLRRCFQEIVRRHEVLRTNFRANGGKPMQFIAPPFELELAVIDLTHLPDSRRKVEAWRQAVKESQQPFDLASGTLFRTRLYRLGDQDHLLLIVTHHIVFDGWSESVLLNEIALLYRECLNAEAPSLPDLAIQYADYALWQERRFEAGAWEEDVTYWRQQLNKPLPQLNLPTDRPRPAVQTYRGAEQNFALPVSLAEQLKELISREQVTLFMALLAAFKTLLYHYTGQQDMLVGVPTAGRNQIETESLIGAFINTLVLRTDLSGDPSFRELLHRMRKVALEAYSHQQLPFDKLIEVSLPERNLDRHSLFDVMFQLRNLPSPLVMMPGLKIDSVNLHIGVAKFDLTLEIVDRPHSLECRFEYNTDLFNPNTILRMAGHYQTLLESVVADPAQRISDLPLLTGQEQHQLVVEWNDTKKDFPQDKCIHQLFEAQVEICPDAIAVVFERQELTYRELNSRANQLAHHLRNRGVGREVLVAICMERSLAMIIGLLGILKAGGAYVPLDPDYPKERLALLMEDTRSSVLLTQEKLLDMLPPVRAEIVCLDADWEEIEKENRHNPGNETATENMAYIIYTSGSTGKPKGVAVPHRGVVRLLFGVDYARFDSSRTFLHLAPTAFDASTFEIWGALLHGAKCVLFPGKVSSARELGDLLHDHKVDTLWLTASLFNAVMDDTPETLSGVRQLLIGGEPLSMPHVQRALALLPETTIINGYGPTESTTFACVYRMPRRLDESINSIPIGRPIANTQAYILDGHLHPVPVGIYGEIYIGGEGLARGYLNSRELTAEKFIPNPFSDNPGARLYRTGDLARYLPDGNIEFLGRADDQVKIRGYRIELGEIEAVLSQHPAVLEAVVVARDEVEYPNSKTCAELNQSIENPKSAKRLFAYVVDRRGAGLPMSELRSFLRRKLPEYMIPSAFVLLDALPLTPNGKIDRKALPASVQSRPELEQGYQAPRAPMEETLAEIWREVLKMERIGIHDNFFDLGGHSLLATQVISRVRKAFHVDMALRTLFEKPTIAELANAILAQQAQALDSGALTGILDEIKNNRTRKPNTTSQ